MIKQQKYCVQNLFATFIFNAYFVTTFYIQLSFISIYAKTELKQFKLDKISQMLIVYQMDFDKTK